MSVTSLSQYGNIYLNKEENTVSLALRLREFKEHERELQWEGTFEKYLGIVEQNPAVANTAHARVYDMIVSAGVEEVDGHKIYHFFENELFGLLVAWTSVNGSSY
jgi:serine protein kinase